MARVADLADLWPSWPNGEKGTVLVSTVVNCEPEALANVIWSSNAQFQAKAHAARQNTDYVETPWLDGLDQLPSFDRAYDFKDPIAPQDDAPAVAAGKMRMVRWKSPASAIAGRAFNGAELHRVTSFDAKHNITIEACVLTDAPYCDNIRTVCEYTMAEHTAGATMLTIRYCIVYVKAVNRMLKMVISKGAENGLRQNFVLFMKTLGAFVSVGGTENGTAGAAAAADASRGAQMRRSDSDSRLAAAHDEGAAARVRLSKLARMLSVGLHIGGGDGGTPSTAPVSGWFMLFTNEHLAEVMIMVAVWFHKRFYSMPDQEGVKREHISLLRLLARPLSILPLIAIMHAVLLVFSCVLSWLNSLALSEPWRRYGSVLRFVDLPDNVMEILTGFLILLVSQKLLSALAIWGWQLKKIVPDPRTLTKKLSINLPSSLLPALLSPRPAASAPAQPAAGAVPEDAASSTITLQPPAAAARTEYSSGSWLSGLFLQSRRTTDGGGSATVMERGRQRSTVAALYESFQVIDNYIFSPTPESPQKAATAPPRGGADEGDEVVEEVFENERKQPFRGWGHSWPGHFLPTDPVGHWSVRGSRSLGKDAFDFEKAAPSLPSDAWEWRDGVWKVDMSGLSAGCVDSDGWTYALDFSRIQFPPQPGSGRDTLSTFVRRRRWYRTRGRCEAPAAASPAAAAAVDGAAIATDAASPASTKSLPDSTSAGESEYMSEQQNASVHSLPEIMPNAVRTNGTGDAQHVGSPMAADIAVEKSSKSLPSKLMQALKPGGIRNLARSAMTSLFTEDSHQISEDSDISVEAAANSAEDSHKPAEASIHSTMHAGHGTHAMSDTELTTAAQHDEAVAAHVGSSSTSADASQDGSQLVTSAADVTDSTAGESSAAGAAAGAAVAQSASTLQPSTAIGEPKKPQQTSDAVDAVPTSSPVPCHGVSDNSVSVPNGMSVHAADIGNATTVALVGDLPEPSSATATATMANNGTDGNNVKPSANSSPNLFPTSSLSPAAAPTAVPSRTTSGREQLANWAAKAKKWFGSPSSSSPFNSPSIDRTGSLPVNSSPLLQSPIKSPKQQSKQLRWGDAAATLAAEPSEPPQGDLSHNDSLPLTFMKKDAIADLISAVRSPVVQSPTTMVPQRSASVDVSMVRSTVLTKDNDVTGRRTTMTQDDGAIMTSSTMSPSHTTPQSDGSGKAVEAADTQCDTVRDAEPPQPDAMVPPFEPQDTPPAVSDLTTSALPSAVTHADAAQHVVTHADLAQHAVMHAVRLLQPIPVASDHATDSLGTILEHADGDDDDDLSAHRSHAAPQSEDRSTPVVPVTSAVVSCNGTHAATSTAPSPCDESGKGSVNSVEPAVVVVDSTAGMTEPPSTAHHTAAASERSTAQPAAHASTTTEVDGTGAAQAPANDSKAVTHA